MNRIISISPKPISTRIVKSLLTSICTLFIFVGVHNPANAQDFYKKVQFTVDQDGLDILGHVKIDGRFIFNGAPYIRWEYADLTITRVTTSGYETFDSSHEGFPLVINSGGYKIKLDAAVYKGYDSGNGYCVNDRDHSGNGTMFQVDVYPVSDISEVTEATSFYKGHNSSKYSDAKLWQECSDIRYIYVNSLSGNIISMIKAQINKIKADQKAREKAKKAEEEKEKSSSTGNKSTSSGSTQQSNQKKSTTDEKKQRVTEQEQKSRENSTSNTSGVKTNSSTQLYFDYMEKGRAAEARGDFQSAINYYQSAYNIAPSPALANKLQNLRENQGAAALVQTAALLDEMINIEMHEVGQCIGGSFGIYKDAITPTQRSVNLFFQRNFYNQFFTASAEIGFSGHPSRNIDFLFRVPMGFGVGTNYFGAYGLISANIGLRLSTYGANSGEDRFVMFPQYGFKTYFKIGSDTYINLLFLRNFKEDAHLYEGPGYVRGTWNFNLGIGFGV